MGFSHIDESGSVKMVDVSGKPVIKSTACAVGTVHLKEETAKMTGDLIPLCHPLPLDSVSVDFEIEENRIDIRAEAVATARTGVEMEALTAVSVAALTIYDMCKAVDKEMTIGGITLQSKTKEPA